MNNPQNDWGLCWRFAEMKNKYGALGCAKIWEENSVKPSAANWNMVGYVSFPVTLELSVLNTENKLFIYVIVS